MNQHQDDFTPAERDQLEQELLELHFGCHEQQERIEARLAAEPAVQALQQSVRQKAAALEQAVRPTLPPLELRPPRAPRQWRRLRSPAFRLGTALAAAAAIVLGFFVADRVARGRHVSQQQEHLHLTISAPKAVPAGAPWSFTVQAQDLGGNAAACRVRWQAFGGSNTVLGAGEAPLLAGSTTIAMAANLVVPERIEVLASHSTDEVRQVFELSTAAAGPLVHVTTDRPVYRPGEPVFVRAVVLDRVTRLPLPTQLPMQAQLLDPKDAPVTQDVDHYAPAGVGSFRLAVPADSQGGPHRVRIAAADGSFPAEYADIVVRSFQTPQLKKTIVLDRVSYAPGARGAATVTVERLGIGGFASGARAKAALVIDGSEVWTEQRPLGGNGEATFRFVVPKDVDQGAARFVATITDGGVVETEVKPFVVPTGKVLLSAFPEGGELIAGVENGLYLECTDPLGRAIDAAGELIDAQDQQVVRFRTAHQGRVRVSFVPREGATYRVRLAGHEEPFDLPAVQPRGIALRLLGDDIVANAPLRMAAAGRGDGPWLLGVFCRGVLVGQTTMRADERGELRAETSVELPPHAAGVLRATVFDRTLQPIAERLVRRHSAHRLKVALLPKDVAVNPGDPQQIDVRTTDETGKLVAAVCGLRVSDLAAVSLGSEPRVGLVDHALLFADVERMENLGDFFVGDDYLGNDAGSGTAPNVDLLLGTRGWRRFVWQNDAAALAKIASRGKVAEGTLAREGFSHTPQVISNLAAAKAAGQPLAHGAWRAERDLRTAASAAGVALFLLGFVEAIAWLMRRSLKAPPVLQGFVGVLAAGGLLLLVVALAQSGVRDMAPAASLAARDFVGGGRFALTSGVPTVMTLGASVEMSRGYVRDFDVEVAQAAATVWTLSGSDDDFGPRSTFSRNAPSVPTDPAANPLAGAFYNDGVDGDVQARAGFFVTAIPEAKLERATGGGGRGRFAAGWLESATEHWRQRQYAHRHTPSDDRRDFTPTVYWNTLLVTDANGAATATFATSDAVTTWLVEADAHLAAGPIGRLGQAKTTFTARLPFQVEAKLPDEVSAGDRLLLPIAAVATDPALTAAELTVDLGRGLRLTSDAPTRIVLTNGRGRALLPITVDSTVGNTTLTIAARAGRFVDRVQQRLQIVPRGFPHRRSAGGSVASGSVASGSVASGSVASGSVAANAASRWSIAVPADAVPGSGNVTLKVYPSPISTLTESLAGILREPHGCFEQASSSNYPNTLVLTLLEANGDDVPVIAARARALLPRGYDKIVGYECKRRGYEWFGADPGHEALTAYGLLQFHDMAKVHDVDRAMVERTQQWLLGRRDGKGNFVHAGTDHHSFGGRSQTLTNAYVTYALLQAGMKAQDLTHELTALTARSTTKDPYELALIACALHLADRPEARAVRQALAAMQHDDGSLHGTTTSITMSGGKDLIVETTGFAVLAFLSTPEFQGRARKAVEFLQQNRSAAGTFGATQATITALRALTAYATESRATRAAGTLRVFEGDRQLAERPFAAEEVAAITIELWHLLTPGAHELRLEVDGGGSALPWAGDVSYHAEQPADDPDTKLSLTTQLRTGSVTEGDTVALDVTVGNRTEEAVPTPIAIIGLPAGCELPTRVLEDLQRASAFAFWELRGRELVLYWRELPPGAKQSLTLDLVARVPGTTSGPASRAYLYYTPEQKRWAPPLVLDIAPR